MKVLHIITNLQSGGAERMLSKIVNNDDEFSHVVVTLIEGEIHYNIKFAKVIPLNYENKTINKFLLLFKLVYLIRKEKPTIVQTWMKSNYYGPLIKVLFPKLKIIANYRHGYRKKHKLPTLFFLNKFLNKFDGHIFVSESTLKERLNAGLKFNNQIIINNGYETPLDTLVKPSTYKDAFVIGHMARYNPIKNQINLIKAFEEFSQNKNVFLVLAGRGLNNSNLGVSKAMENKIIYLGEVTEIDQFFKYIDIFILTSISEGFPNVLCEAMSYKKPVLTTDAGESFNIIGDIGYQIHGTDVSHIKEALEQAYKDKKNLAIKGQESGKRIRDYYGIKKILNSYQEYYKKIGGKL